MDETRQRRVSPSGGNTGDAEGSPVVNGAGRLAVVALPLGNLEDLSPRARRVLGEADVILAEDTRSARRLVEETGAAGRGARIVSCFDGNEAQRAAEAVEWISAGQTVVLVSEAGTPLLSDPGYRVVAAVAKAQLRVEPVPGPSALLAALVASALPPDRFVFLGFPPRKPGARRRLFESVRELPFTLVFYESPLRVHDSLVDLADTLGGQRAACVARELTKRYEEFVRGTLADLEARYRDTRPLGEVTLVVAGAGTNAEGGEATEAAEQTWTEEARSLLAEGASVRDVADQLATQFGRPRREMYALVLRLAQSER